MLCHAFLGHSITLCHAVLGGFCHGHAILGRSVTYKVIYSQRGPQSTLLGMKSTEVIACFISGQPRLDGDGPLRQKKSC